MAQSIDALNIPAIVRYSGVYDFTGLYRMMYNWFFKQRYEFHEDLYKDKVDTIGTEVEIKWRGEKKITEFIKFVIKVEFHIWKKQEVEVIRNGQKTPMTKANMQIIFKGEVVIDYAEQYNQSFDKKLLGILQQQVLNKDIEFLYVDRLTYIIYEYQTEVKKFLGMQAPSNAWSG